MMSRIFLFFFFVTSLYSSDKYRVAALYWSMNIPGQVAMRDGLLKELEIINKEAKKEGRREIELYEYIAGDGEEGIERQIKQMYEAIEKRVDLIVIQPTDNAALIPPLLKSNKEKIPVVAYDQYISEGEIHSYLTSDNYAAGYLNGEYISSMYENQKEINIALVEYPHVSSTVERVDGFLDALRDSGQRYKIVSSYKAVEPKSGKQAGMDILRDFPQKGSIDVIFTVNDGGGLSVVEELANAKRDEIVVATIDGDPASIENIKKGRLTKIDSAQFCGPLGGEALKAGYDILEGKEYYSKILIPVYPVTKETLENYPGWLGPIPEGFKKPWSAKEIYWDSKLKKSR